MYNSLYREVWLMKRLIALAVAICIATALLAAPTSASGEVFVAAGNTVLPLSSAMPVYSGGAWYIDYQCFTKGGLNVSSSYSAADGTLVLYTWDTTLVFDVNSAMAYTTADKTKYKQWTFVSSGTVYVPAQFTAQTLGLEYYYFPELPLIRIKKSDSIPNNMFIYIAQEKIPDLIDAYNMNKKPQNGSTSGQGTGNGASGGGNDSSESETGRKSIHLTFNISDGKNLGKIIDLLQKYNYKATFFVRGSVVRNNADALRRAVVTGHNLGTLSENGNADFSGTVQAMISALDAANENLFEATRTKTRLVRVPSGSGSVLSKEKRNALAENGYRIWDYNVNPAASLKSYSSSSLYRSAVNLLSRRNGRTVLVMDDSDASVGALSRILAYISAESYAVRQISLLDTPVNQVGEKR